MARYEFPIEVLCDGCNGRSPAKLVRAEFARLVPDKGAVQPVRGKAMKVDRATQDVVVLPDGWLSTTANAQVMAPDPSVKVTCFAPAHEVSRHTGLSQEAYLCPKCVEEAGLKKPEAVPESVTPS